MAAFAEGRQEIDREFLETVVAAQGESLEGPDQSEGGLEQDRQQAERPELLEAGDQSDQASGELIEAGSREFVDHQLRREILELSERMARLEGLVLDLVGQLVPAITKFFAHLPSESAKPDSPPQPSLPLDDQEAPEQAPESQSDEPPSPSKKSWWARLFGP